MRRHVLFIGGCHASLRHELLSRILDAAHQIVSTICNTSEGLGQPE